MTSISNDDFIAFLDLYTVNPKYYDTVTEISWPKKPNGDTDRSKEPLINNGFKMLSLDDICRECSKFNKNNLPSTTDALWYNINDEGKLVLYFIEFKWHNLDAQKNQKILDETFLALEKGTQITTDMKNKFKKIRKSYVDEDVTFKLRLKPFESLFIVLPKLFEDYCENEGKDSMGLHEFLVNCEIKVYSFVSTYTKPKEPSKKNKNKSMKIEINQSKKSKRNKSHMRSDFNRTIGPKGSIGNTVRQQYKRLELSPFIDFADVFPKSSFDIFLETEGLMNIN